MFTGIVEKAAEVVSVSRSGELARIEIDAGHVAEGVALGESIAVNGCCLTICAAEGDRLSFEAVRETLDRTNIGELERGSRVNLERAMAANGRFDGHIVQGHVDGVGCVRELRRSGDDVVLVVECDADLAGQLVDKGSVTIDGVSLTVVHAGEDWFDVALIPTTLAETTLGQRQSGDRVNLEVDILGKYVARQLARILGKGGAGGEANRQG